MKALACGVEELWRNVENVRRVCLFTIPAAWGRVTLHKLRRICKLKDCTVFLSRKDHIKRLKILLEML